MVIYIIEEELDEDEVVVRSITSNLRMNIGSSSSRRSWAPESSTLHGDHHVFERSSEDDDDEEELKWAATERLPTFERLSRKSINVKQSSSYEDDEEVDISNLGMNAKNQLLLDGLLRTVEQDNEKFLTRMRQRIHRFLALISLIFLSTKLILCSYIYPLAT